MKRNQGIQATRSGGGEGPRPSFRRCKDCRRVTLKSYMKYHVCPLNAEGEIDVEQEREKPKVWKKGRRN